MEAGYGRLEIEKMKRSTLSFYHRVRFVSIGSRGSASSLFGKGESRVM